MKIYLKFQKRRLLHRRKKQNVVGQSSVKAKVRVMTHGIYEGLWMKIILDDLKVKYEELMKFFCDNNATISISHNPIQHDRTKHIKIDKHFIKGKCKMFSPKGSLQLDFKNSMTNHTVAFEAKPYFT
ncbi:Copia protein, partial [Mucuna pruriens]